MKSLLLKEERIKWLLVVHISKQKEPEGLFLPCTTFFSSTTVLLPISFEK